MNTFLKNYLQGEASYGFWNLVTKGLAIANALIVISSLSLYEYGLFQLLLVSYAGLSVFLNIGGGAIRNDILRFEAEGKSAEAKKLFFESIKFRIITGFVMWIGVFFLAPVMAADHGSQYVVLIKAISFLFLHDALLNSFTTLIEMRKKFNVVASRLFVAKLGQLLFLLPFLFFWKVDVQIVVISLIFSMFISLISLLPPFFNSYKPWKEVSRSNEGFMFKILKSYGKWEVFEPIANKFTSLLEVWAIKFFISTEAVAVFSIAQTLVNTISGFLPTKTLLTLVPFEISNEERLKKIYTSGVKYLGVLALIFAVGAFIFVPYVVMLVFPKYIVSLPYFKVLVWALPLSAMVGVSSIFLISLRRQKFLFFIKVIKSVTVTVLYLTLLPLFGLWGMIYQYYIWSIMVVVIIWIYLIRTKPQLFVKWHDLVSFGEEDKIFLDNIFRDIKSYTQKRFFS